MPEIVPGIDEIRARLAACPIPVDVRSDWDGTNHYEMHCGGLDFFWLTLDGDVPLDCRTEFGKRLGAVLDYAAAYRRDVAALLALLGAVGQGGKDTARIAEMDRFKAKIQWLGDDLERCEVTLWDHNSRMLATGIGPDVRTALNFATEKMLCG